MEALLMEAIEGRLSLRTYSLRLHSLPALKVKPQAFKRCLITLSQCNALWSRVWVIRL